MDRVSLLYWEDTKRWYSRVIPDLEELARVAKSLEDFYSDSTVHETRVRNIYGSDPSHPAVWLFLDKDGEPWVRSNPCK